jgi:hypothetical protein
MIYSWQYNGVASWDELLVWCMKNLYHGEYYKTNWYTNHRDTFYFTDEKEYMLFLLRWA